MPPLGATKRSSLPPTEVIGPPVIGLLELLGLLRLLELLSCLDSEPKEPDELNEPLSPEPLNPEPRNRSNDRDQTYDIGTKSSTEKHPSLLTSDR